MPLYEYKCQECRETFEILQRMGAGPDGLACPTCGGHELRKEHSTFAAVAVSSAMACGAPSAAACGTSGGPCAPGGRFT